MIEQPRPELYAQDASDCFIDGRLRQSAFLEQLSAVLVVEAADHFHVDSGIERSLGRIGIIGSQTMILELSYGRVITDDEPVKLPFAAQNFRQGKRIS